MGQKCCEFTVTTELDSSEYVICYLKRRISENGIQVIKVSKNTQIIDLVYI